MEVLTVAGTNPVSGTIKEKDFTDARAVGFSEDPDVSGPVKGKGMFLDLQEAEVFTMFKV